MPNTPITQAALDRVEEHLRAEIALAMQHLRDLMGEADRRYEQRFNDSQTAVDAALNAAKEAVQKAEAAADKRFEGLNELRGAMEDQQRTLMPRAEAELQTGALDKRIKALEEANIERQGRSKGMTNTWGMVVGAVGFLATILAIAAYFAVKKP